MGFTSGVGGAGSNGDHAIEIRASGVTKSILLPNLPGDDYLEHKGDLWKVTFSALGFEGCIKKGNIEDIAIEESSDDGWHIESIVTFVKSGSSYELATMDFGVNKWVDGDQQGTHRLAQLAIV